MDFEISHFCNFRNSVTLTLDGVIYIAHHRVSFIDLYIDTKFCWNQKNFLSTDGGAHWDSTITILWQHAPWCLHVVVIRQFSFAVQCQSDYSKKTWIQYQFQFMKNGTKPWKQHGFISRKMLSFWKIMHTKRCFLPNAVQKNSRFVVSLLFIFGNNDCAQTKNNFLHE